MSPADKPLLVREMRDYFAQWKSANQPDAQESRMCLYWSVLAQQYLKRKGHKAIVAAGSMSWPKINLPDEDDGVCCTHYSYVWEPDSLETALMILTHQMPEMHCWVVLPKRQEILDVTTRYIRGLHDALDGQSKWTAPDPPDYLWCRWDELPPNVIYNPSRSAVDLVVKMVKRTWGVV
jgi:hypothetical protein